jgi:hypothetical protein
MPLTEHRAGAGLLLAGGGISLALKIVLESPAKCLNTPHFFQLRVFLAPEPVPTHTISILWDSSAFHYSSAL